MITGLLTESGQSGLEPSRHTEFGRSTESPIIRAGDVEAIAVAIYKTHSPTSDWETAGEDVRRSVFAQAFCAIRALRARGWREPVTLEPARLVDVETEATLTAAGLER